MVWIWKRKYLFSFDKGKSPNTAMTPRVVFAVVPRGGSVNFCSFCLLYLRDSNQALA